MSRGNAAGAAPASTSAPGLWQRRPDDTRHNLYVPEAFGRRHRRRRGDPDADGPRSVDWECELAVVMGRTAKHVRIDKANDYIFGYTSPAERRLLMAGGRSDARHGSDWLIGKGAITSFAPMGPFIVPQEFVPRYTESSGSSSR